jgi:hypothetical protein
MNRDDMHGGLRLIPRHGLILAIGLTLALGACRAPAGEPLTPAASRSAGIADRAGALDRSAAEQSAGKERTPGDGAAAGETISAGAAAAVEPLSNPGGSAAADAALAGGQPLVVWTTSVLGSTEGGEIRGDGGSAGSAFAASLAAFRAAHPELAVELQARAPRGPAGTGAFLQSTARVAPARLPDVALLPLDGLAAAGAMDLIRPLPASVLSARALDTYPFAAAAVRGPQGVWGVPVALDVVHAIGREVAPPATWPALRGIRALVLPSGGADLAELAAPLALYGAAGGDLDRTETPDPTAMADLVALLSTGIAEGALVRPKSGGSPRAAWNTMVTGEDPAAIVSGAVFAPQQAKFPGLFWGPLPGPAGPARPLGWGWAWVLTAREPERVAPALAFIEWFTDPANGAWVTEAGFLPAGRADGDTLIASAFDPPPAAEYRRFLTEQLDIARGTAGFDTWGPGWAALIDDVLAGRPIDPARTQLSQSSP